MFIYLIVNHVTGKYYVEEVKQRMREGMHKSWERRRSLQQSTTD